MRKIIILTVLALMTLTNVSANNEWVTIDFLSDLINQYQVENNYNSYLEMKEKREEKFQDKIMNLLTSVEQELDNLK